jgi:alpha-amylase
VVIGLDLPIGTKELPTGSIFSDGTVVRDTYSGKEAVVTNSKVTIDSEFGFVLLELKN